MEDFNGEVEPAGTKYRHWFGEVSADDVDQFDAIYGLLNLDRTLWWIVALRLSAEEGVLQTSAYAIRHPATAKVLTDTIRGGDPINVTNFIVVEDDFEGWAHTGALERVSPYDVLHRGFKRWDVLLKSEVLQEHPEHKLIVVDTVELGEPDSQDA